MAEIEGVQELLMIWFWGSLAVGMLILIAYLVIRLVEAVRGLNKQVNILTGQSGATDDQTACEYSYTLNPNIEFEWRGVKNLHSEDIVSVNLHDAYKHKLAFDTIALYWTDPNDGLQYLVEEMPKHDFEIMMKSWQEQQ